MTSSCSTLPYAGKLEDNEAIARCGLGEAESY
jgi:hypothetical protein